MIPPRGLLICAFTLNEIARACNLLGWIRWDVLRSMDIRSFWPNNSEPDFCRPGLLGMEIRSDQADPFEREGSPWCLSNSRRTLLCCPLDRWLHTDRRPAIAYRCRTNPAPKPR